MIGPGSYRMTGSFDKAMIKREFRQTSQRYFPGSNRSESPGPGNYSPSNKASKLSAPKYGFGTEKKIHTLKSSNGPSPSTYIVNDSITKKNFQASGMGYGQKINPVQVLVDTPGPGSYVKFYK